MRALRRKGKTEGISDLLMAFMKSWEIQGTDELSICSSVLDVLRAYLGDRPCCAWKNRGNGVEKLTERGVVEVLFSGQEGERQAALSRVLVTGASDFDRCPISSLSLDVKGGFDGFLHVPIKSREEVLGVLTLAAVKKEARDHAFVEPLECLGRLVAIAIQHGEDREQIRFRENKLKAELGATSRELEQTNRRLIERVRELKTLYRELQKRVEELTRANSAKNEFLSIVSHELRTPLTSLTGFLSVLLDEEAGPLNEQQLKFLKITKQSAQRLNLIISDLLDISRIESGKLNVQMLPSSLCEIIKRSVDDLRGAAQNKNVDLVCEANDDLPPILADPNRIQQVIDNLISNAIKFTDQNGTILVTSQEKGDFLQVSVKDSGPGLSPEEKEKVFDMFYQADASTRRPKGGAGLGLAIARGIVNMHGGQLWVSSQKGHGATFAFVLPRQREKRAA